MNEMGTAGWNGNGWMNTGNNWQTPMNTVSRPIPGPLPTEQKGITTIATVSGRENAATYPVAAGQTALLIWFQDPNKGKFWLKTTDIYGRDIPMLEFDFNQFTQQQDSGSNEQDVVSKKDFEELKSMFTSLYNELHG